MDGHKNTARAIGVLFIIGTVAGILSVVFTTPVREAQDPLLGIAANETQLILGALCVMVMGLALAMVPVMAFPVLKKYNEPLALGYVVFRGGFEAITDLAIAVNLLLLRPLSHVYQAGSADASRFQSLARLLLDVNELSTVLTIVFILGAVMFYWTLYQARLVPRWLSGWGLVATIPYLAAGLFGLFGLISATMSSTSSLHTLMMLPLAVQEMVLAVWLIVKGFNAPEKLK